MALKIYSVIGARPQFVKAAVVSRALARHRNIEERLVHTGQHYDHAMSEIFFTELGLPAPHVNLGIGSGAHGAQTGRMLAALETLFVAEKPDRVLIYGDTNSTLAAALAAAKLQVPVDHVEAGLRSFNRAMPEEINRVVADALSDQLFAPTVVAVDHLRREGIPESRIHRVGDVMYDATRLFGARADAGALQRLNLTSKTYVLATIHRAENTDDEGKLRLLFAALARVAAELPVILPVHPRTRQRAQALGLLDALPAGFSLTEPVGYFDMLALERGARAIATDSGGVQKEAFFHHVPCVTLRTETEWVELVDSGWNTLAPPDSADTVAAAIRRAAALDLSGLAHPDAYGDGRAAEHIAARIASLAP